jgi:hypothetical protein
MEELTVSEQHELVGGDFEWGSFLRGAACGGALAAGALAGPIGIIGGITACMVLTYDDAQ